MNYKTCLVSCGISAALWLSGLPTAHAQQATIMYRNDEGKALVLKEATSIKNNLDEIEGIAGDFSQEALKKLAKDENIQHVQLANPILHISETVTTSNVLTTKKQLWNNKIINIQEAWKKGYTGKNIKIGIIDSPVAKIAGLKITKEKLFISKNYAASATSHGTFITGIINTQANAKGEVTGIAPGAKVYSIAVVTNKSAYLDNVIAGINYAIKEKMNIINLSFGISKADLLGAHETIANNPLAIAIKKAQKAGIIVVAASGNNGETIDYPAAFKDVVSVGSIDESKMISYFTNIGPELSVFAPGEAIQSFSYKGKVIYGSGTSYAAPHVVGMLAILKEQFPKDSNSQLINRMKLMTIPYKKDSFSAYSSSGILQYPKAGNFTSITKEMKDKEYVAKNKTKITAVIKKMNANKKVNYKTEYLPISKVYSALTTKQKATVKRYSKKHGYKL